MRDVFVVPETKLAVELLQEFQERRRQIAMVVDEFGSTVGIVTAEDVLEQVVGELEDEFDIASRTANCQLGRGDGAGWQHDAARPGHAAALELSARGWSGDAGRLSAGAAGPSSGVGESVEFRWAALTSWRRWPADASRGSAWRRWMPSRRQAEQPAERRP